MYMEKPVAIGKGLFKFRSSPQKSRTPYNKNGCGFFVAFQ